LYQFIYITTITYLYLNNLSILSIPYLSYNLNHIDLTNCDYLTEIPKIPNGVKKLKITNCPLLNVLELSGPIDYLYIIESNIKEIITNDCNVKNIYIKEMNELIELPDSITKSLISCEIIKCNKLQKIGDFSELGLLTKLYIESCELLSLNRILPDSITNLYLNNVNIAINTFPYMLRELQLINCNLIEEIILSPNSIFINIYGCNNLVSISPLPQLTDEFILDTCNKIVHLPKLNNKLSKLLIKNCISIEKLPDLPDSLIELNCNNITISELPEFLPNSLGILLLFDTQINRLPNTLPNTLRFIGISRTNITNLPNNLPQCLLQVFASKSCLTQTELLRLRNNGITVSI